MFSQLIVFVRSLEDGTSQVCVSHPDGSETRISGFPGVPDAENFIHFGDLEAEGDANAYVLVTNPSFNLRWSHACVN